MPIVASRETGAYAKGKPCVALHKIQVMLDGSRVRHYSTKLKTAVLVKKRYMDCRPHLDSLLHKFLKDLLYGTINFLQSLIFSITSSKKAPEIRRSRFSGF